MKKLILVFAAISFSYALEAQSGKIGNLEWKLRKNTLIITGCGGIPDYRNKVPAWYECRKKIETVVIETGVTSVGNWAFYSCNNLTSVIIPNSVTSIGNWAFYGCRNLISITLPNSVKSIGDDAFGYCAGLTFVSIPNGVIDIGEDAFEHCINLQSITIPNGVTKIRSGTFSHCYNLQTINIPGSVTHIGNYAFNHCLRLKTVFIPGSVSSIGTEAFNHCPNLLKIDVDRQIPINISDKCVFNQVPSLAVVYVPKNSKSLYQNADGWKEFRVMEGTTVYEKRNVPTYETANLPEIDWLFSSNSNTNKKEFNIKACIQSKTKIKQVSLLINRQKQKGINAVPNDGCEFAVDQTINLVDGPNTIKLLVENEFGIKETERVINYTPLQVDGVNKRYALIMGNASYKADPLNNPVNDAIDLEAKLRQLGFTTVLLKNASKERMEYAIRDVALKAQGYDAVMFFYSGHAIQYEGKNHLIPVDVNLQTPSDISYCIDMDLVLGKMEDSQCKMKIVVLDACRNNPFPGWSRGGDKGLTGMNAPSGTFIAYAAAKGRVAQDGMGRNSPYTEAFLELLDVPKLNILDFFQELGDRVKLKTNKFQTPWTESSFSGKFYFNNK